MSEKRTHFQLLMDCVDLLEAWVDGENPRVDTKILLNEMYERTKRNVPVGRIRNHALTVKYAQAKELVSKGKQIGVACSTVGITRDQFCRRRRMEQQGRDRKERREY